MAGMLKDKKVRKNSLHYFLTFFPNERRGLMDDFTDLLSFVLIISMIGFFAFVVLHADAGDKTEQTLDRIESFHGQEALLALVNSPASFGDEEVVMKDIIFLAVNAHDEALFTATMEKYFEERQMEGGVGVYDSVSYGTEEKPEPLLLYKNGVFLGEEKGAIYLTDTQGIGNKKIVVKLFG